MKFIAAVQPEEAVFTPVLVFLFNQAGVAIDADGVIPTLAPDDPLLSQATYLGRLDEQPCYVAHLSPDSGHPLIGWMTPVRSLYAQIPDELYALIGYASQILTWRTNHAFCSKCGHATDASSHERAMICPQCDFMSYPRISPCIIVAVSRGEKLLMARGPHFPEGLYSLIAGFMEPGETVEQCVVREVFEETTLQIKNIRYITSQPWAFPHSIMMGFSADYAGGEIQRDPVEIEDAGWYTAKNMPQIPERSAIARWLIDAWLTRQNGARQGQPQVACVNG